METLQFSILIHAGKRKVWDTMLQDKSYREWSREFHAGSYYEGSWTKGSEIRFLAPDDQGVVQGLFSRIKDNIPYQFISIEHLGVINNGVVDTTSDEVKKWTPSFENYTFTEVGDSTKLTIDMQIEPDYKSMFEEMWPRALKTLKALCEQ
jgi:hypothetical protein